MNKAFNNFTWENDPSVNTPISAENLNKVNSALDTVDTRVVQHETTKANQTDMLTAITSVSLDEDTGIFTFTRHNGTSFTVDTKLEKIVLNYRFDSETQILYLILEDGTEMPVDLSAFITNVEFADSDTIRYSITDGGKVVFDIIDGSITGDKLEPNYLANVQIQAENASKSASNALQSATEAEASAVRAEEAAEKAEGIVGGDFATNSRVDDIVNGTTKVGNSDKLDGHDSEYFAPLDLVKCQAMPTGTDLNDLNEQGIYFFDGLATNYTNTPSDTAHNGIMTVDVYEYPVYGTITGVQRYTSINLGVTFERVRKSSTWQPWKTLATTLDLANYFKNTGGVLSGDLKLVSSDTTKKVFQLKNSLRTINFIIYTDGTFRIEDAKNGKKLLDSNVSGKTEIDATASGITGNKLVGGARPIDLKNETVGGVGAFIGFETASAYVGALGISEKKPTFAQASADGGNQYEIHHDGNSAKVVVSDTAPSDTSAVWFDTSA